MCPFHQFLVFFPTRSKNFNLNSLDNSPTSLSIEKWLKRLKDCQRETFLKSKNLCITANDLKYAVVTCLTNLNIELSLLFDAYCRW